MDNQNPIQNPQPPNTSGWGMREVLWILQGPDGKGGIAGELKTFKDSTAKELEELKAQNDEMYGVFKVLKWGVLYLIGPGGILLIAGQAIEFFRSAP